jgi:hypothetical protein
MLRELTTFFDRYDDDAFAALKDDAFAALEDD